MNTNLCLAGFDQDFTDLEVEHLIVPSTGQNIVPHAGQRVTHEEISITQNQSFWHLHGELKSIIGTLRFNCFLTELQHVFEHLVSGVF